MARVRIVPNVHQPYAGAGKGERIHGSVARHVGVAIVSGAKLPGAPLEDEITASGRLKVSRSAYREAMKILAAKGLIQSRPKTGSRVSPREQWHILDPDVLGWIFEGGSPDRAIVKGLFELRMIIEPAASELAANHRDENDLSAMRRALVNMERHGISVEEGRAADRAFHDSLLKATRNPALVALSPGICAAIRWTTVFKQQRNRLARDPMPEHWLVFDAIAVGSPERARAAMQRLVALALEDTREEIEP